MVKWYYTVIVGTRPGVYEDWTQAAPKVIEVSGSIHKKYKTRAEAWEAFHMARQRGAVRTVPVDPQSDMASSSSDSSPQPSAARDNRARFRRQNRAQAARNSLNEPPSEGEIVERPGSASVVPRRATRLQDYLQRKRAAASSTLADIMSPTHAGPSGFAGGMDRVAVDADEPQERHGANQESRNVPLCVDRSGSPSSRSADSPTRGRNNERWQGSQQGQAEELPHPSRADISHAAAILHPEVRPMSTSTETERRLGESPGVALSQSAETSHATHRVSHLPQIDQGVPENRDPACTYGLPLTSSPLSVQISSADIEHEAYTPGSPVASPRTQGKRDEKGKKRASVRSTDFDIDTFDWSEILRPSRPQATLKTDDYPNSPVLSRPPSACSYISLASSTDSFISVFSFDINFSAVGTSEPSGRSTHPVSPTPLPAASHITLTEEMTPRSPARNRATLSDEDDTPPLMTRPPCTPSDDSRPFENLSDAASPSKHRHSPQVVHHPALDDDDHPDLVRLPSPTIVVSTSIQSTPLTYIDTSPRRPSPLLSPFLSQPYVDLADSPTSDTIGLGLSIKGTALPHQTTRTPQASAGTLPYQPAGTIGHTSQSPIRDDRSPWDAPNPQAEASPSRFRAVACDRTLSGNTRSVDCAAPSPRNVPLPPSPTSIRSGTTSGTSIQLQAQPSHRPSPKHPFYPSLSAAGDDSDSDHRPRAPLPGPSGIHINFGLFTPGLSPVQVPALIRSPSADPRSPIRQGMRIPGDMMGLSQSLSFGRPTPPRNDTRMVP